MKYFKIKFNKNNVAGISLRKSGFTLFIAMIVTSLILSVGFSITNILLKELTLASTSKESQVAFYAADSAAECAMYWDRKYQNTTGSDGQPLEQSPFSPTTGTDPIWKIQCGTGFGNTVNTGQIAGATKTYPDEVGVHTKSSSTFYISFVDAATGYNACAKVVVSKEPGKTEIDARGYNVGYVGFAGPESYSFISCDTSNPRTVERGIKVTY